MKKAFPLLFLVVVVAIFFKSFFLSHLLPIPSDTIVGLYNPFRDLYAKEYPRGVPFKNFLITDPVRQLYPWRYESIQQIKSFHLPLWNPYAFAGSPLLANHQSAVFNPFNLLFFVLPFPYAWSFLIFLQMPLCGIFLFLYLKNLKLHTLSILLATSAFIFSGFFTAWLEWGTVDMVALWLPAILLSIDKIFLEKKYNWYALYFFASIISFFSGHLQIFFYEVLFAHAYIFFRLISQSEKVKPLLIGLPFGILTIAIASIQWIPLGQFILLSERNMDLVTQVGWYIPIQHLITFFVPDFFGNPTTLNYWGVWNYAELAGYIGIPALFFATYACFKKMHKIELFFLISLAIALLFALPTPIAMIPSLLHIPFLSTAQPTRLLFIIDFSLCVLAAFGLSAFMKEKNIKVFIPILLFSFIFISIWILLPILTRLFPSISLDQLTIIKHNLLPPTGIFAMSVCFILFSWYFHSSKSAVYICILCILLISVFDGIRFADKFTSFTNRSYLFPTTKTLQFLQSNLGNFRYMATDSRIFPPNFSVMYHLQTVDGYDPLYTKTYGAFIAASERSMPDIHEPFGFNRIITPHNSDSRLMDLSGVKYVLSLTPLHSQKLREVLREGQTIVYENSSVFPRLFFVKQIIPVATNKNGIRVLFNNSYDLHKTAAVEGYSGQQNFSGNGTIENFFYSPERISFTTNATSDQFLVLTDQYYPTWKAFVDGKSITMYPADLAFRGIVIPKGHRNISFAIQLF